MEYEKAASFVMHIKMAYETRYIEYATTYHAEIVEKLRSSISPKVVYSIS